MSDALLVKDWMTEQVITIGPTDNLMEAFDLMGAHGVRHLPITEEDQILGILTSRDIYRAAPMRGKKGKEVQQILYTTPVGDVMIKEDLKTVRPDDTVGEATQILLDARISSLLVLNEDGTLAGILTAHDLLRGLMDRLES